VSSTLIIVVVIIVNVIATLPQSDNFRGVCRGAIAGRGASNDANFGGSGSGCRRILYACRSVVLPEW
jgi:hypothetical protein